MTHSVAGHKLGQALFLAGKGMHVFPLQPGKRIPVGGCANCRADQEDRSKMHRAEDCPCIPVGRHCHGAHAATTDPDVIRRWWNPNGRNARAGIGIHLAKSGLVMIDLDSHKDMRNHEPLPAHIRRTVSAGLYAADGWDAYAMLCAERRQDVPWEDIRDTVMVRTPSGGLHIWYRVPEAELYRNVDGKLGWQVDFKAGPAFAVAPGTEVWGKGTYAPLGSWGDGPAELPHWLDLEIRQAGGYQLPAPVRYSAAERLRAGRHKAAQPPSPDLVGAVMNEALGSIVMAQSGQRNAALNAAAFRVGRALVSRDESLWDDLAGQLEAMAVDGGTPVSEARATVASGIRGGVAAAQK